MKKNQNIDSRDITVEFITEDGQYQAVFSWLAGNESIDCLADNVDQFLHPNEQEYCQGLKNEHRKKSYLSGRYVAKSALSLLLENIDPVLINVESGVFAHPVVQYPKVANASLQNLEVSISHIEELAVAIACSALHPTGIDVELISRVNASVMSSHIHPAELRSVMQAGDDKSTMCTVLWTAKEALSKVLRCGMYSPFNMMEVNNFSGVNGCYVGEFVNFKQYKFQSWICNDFVLSIVFPKKTKIIIDIKPFLLCFR